MPHKCIEPGCCFSLPDSYPLPYCPWHATPGSGLVKVIGAAGLFALGVGGAYAFGRIRDALRNAAVEEQRREESRERRSARQSPILDRRLHRPANNSDDATSSAQPSGIRDGFDPYKILGVERSASLADVEAGYRRMALKYHPDSGGDGWAFLQVQAACDQIKADISCRAWPPSMCNRMTPDNTKIAVAEITPAVQRAGPFTQRPVAIRPEKNAALAILLAFFFGPIGMLYSDVRGALVLFTVDLILFLPTLGLILLITWPIGVVWAAIGTNSNSTS
jgi:hypothetical protein